MFLVPKQTGAGFIDATNKEKNQTNTQLMGNISVPQKQYLQSKTKDVLSPGGSTFKVGTSPLPSEFQHEGLQPGDFKNIVPEQLFQYT